MPAKSKAQFKLVMAKRGQYKTKAKTPKAFKWVWDPEWTDVKVKELPEKLNESKFDKKFKLIFESLLCELSLRSATVKILTGKDKGKTKSTIVNAQRRVGEQVEIKIEGIWTPAEILRFEEIV